MTLRGLLLLACAALLIGSGLWLIEGSDLASAAVAAFRHEPLLLPEDMFLGTMVFFAVLSVSAAGFLWPLFGKLERREAAVAAELAALARSRREGRSRGKARRAEMMQEAQRRDAEPGRGGPHRAGPHWASWAGAFAAALAISALAAALAPDILPRWLRARGYEPCASIDATRWIRTRQSQAEIGQSGWALPRDCARTD